MPFRDYFVAPSTLPWKHETCRKSRLRALGETGIEADADDYCRSECMQEGLVTGFVLSVTWYRRRGHEVVHERHRELQALDSLGEYVSSMGFDSVAAGTEWATARSHAIGDSKVSPLIFVAPKKTCDCCGISLRSDRSDSERQSPAGHIGGGWAKENEPRTITRIVTEDGPQARYASSASPWYAVFARISTMSLYPPPVRATSLPPQTLSLMTRPWIECVELPVFFSGRCKPADRNARDS